VNQVKSCQTAVAAQTMEYVNRFFNSTSAQLGYTVPLTLVHARKYSTEDK